MKNLLMFGAGQTAEIIFHYFKNDSNYNVVGFTVDGENLKENSFMGLPVVPFETIEKDFPKKDHHIHVALSYKDMNGLREQKYIAVKSKRYVMASYVSSQCGVIGKLNHGDNCIILENQLIQPYVKIGNNVAIWSGSTIGHHSKIEDHCWVTSGATIGGNSTIGSRTFFGMNATVGHMVTIGRESFLGAHCLVTKSAKDYSVYIVKDTECFPLDSKRFMKITTMV